MAIGQSFLTNITQYSDGTMVLRTRVLSADQWSISNRTSIGYKKNRGSL